VGTTGYLYGSGALGGNGGAAGTSGNALSSYGLTGQVASNPGYNTLKPGLSPTTNYITVR
jgi:hypothetical protein